MNPFTKQCHRRWLTFATCGLVACATSLSIAQDTPTAAAFEPKPIQGSLIDFLTGMPVSYQMQLMQTNPLLRPPFAGAPLDSAKGLAAKIKGQELDAKNRIKALKFLGDVDCIEYPESQQVLVKHLQSDPAEKVRLAAAKALEDQLSHGKDKTPSRRERRRKDTCKGCCTKLVLDALTACAYETDEQGCYLEPSERVREAAEDALKTCCDCWGEPGYESNEVEPEIDVPPDAAPKDSQPDKPATTKPRVPPESNAPAKTGRAASGQPQLLPEPASTIESQPTTAELIEAVDYQSSIGQPQVAPVPKVIRQPGPAPVLDASLKTSTIPEAQPFAAPEAAANPQAETQTTSTESADDDAKPLLACLDGRCIVSIIKNKPAPASEKYQSEFQGHRYHFSSLQAKRDFDACPVKYAPMMSGADPVHFRLTGEVKTGSCLIRHGGRTYLFLSQSNASAYLSDLAFGAKPE